MRWAALIGGAFRGELQGCEQAGKAGAEDDDARAARLHGPSQPGSRGKQETPVFRCRRGTPEVQSTIGDGEMPTEPALSAAQWLARQPDRSGQPQGAACRDQGVQLGELSFAVVTGRHRQFLRAPVA